MARLPGPPGSLMISGPPASAFSPTASQVTTGWGSGVGDPGSMPFTEFGATGLRQFSGYVREEWLRDLQGWRGMRMYREMRDNDAVIGAIFFAVEMMLRGVTFRVEPAEKTSQDDVDAAEFVNSCMADIEQPWPSLLAEVLTFLQFGYSVHEIVYKVRRGKSDDPKFDSAYDDGMIGWRKFAGRAQETCLHWEFDESGDATAMIQLLPTGGPLLRVPLEKCLHFRTVPIKNNPEGRALALDTPIPTPEGWKAIAELVVGDRLFDERGDICRVVAKSPIWEQRPVYDLEFSTGETIRADANHLWPVYVQGVKRLKTTEELFRRYQGKGRADCRATGPRQRYRLDRPAALDGDPTPLVVPPYALGAWLGDGATGRAELCYSEDDAEILDYVSASGLSAVHSRDGAGKVRYARLDSHKDNAGRRNGRNPFYDFARALGRKRIPEEYLRADRWSRIELLRGLMDTDGGVSATGHMCLFSQTDPVLAEQVLELARGLGYPARLYEVRTRGSWQIAFAAYKDNAPFHLQRKRDALRTRPKGLRTTKVSLVSVRAAGIAPTVCIEVDAPSNEFICGRTLVPTHNSIMRNAYTSYYMKKKILEIEAIGIERDLTGIPIAWVPPRIMNANANAEDKAQFQVWKKIARDVSRNEQEGLVLPLAFDKDKNRVFEFTLLATGGRRQFDTTQIVDRYDHRITATVLADFIVLGQASRSGVGSYAQSKNKTDLFGIAVVSFLDLITAEFNRKAIPDLLDLNGMAGSCRMTHGDITRTDLQELGQYVFQLAQAGALVPDQELEEHLRSEGGLPAIEGGAPDDLNTGGVASEESDVDAAETATNDPRRGQGASGNIGFGGDTGYAGTPVGGLRYPLANGAARLRRMLSMKPG